MSFFNFWERYIGVAEQKFVYCGSASLLHPNNKEKWFEIKEIEATPKLLDDLMCYDQIVNTVSKGIVCPKCLDEDDKLWRKYRNKDNE